MNLNGYNVGLWPYGPGLDKAGDRRRFVFYANERDIPFEIASLDKIYDIVYLTMGCNISAWLQYKKKYPNVKIVFEIIDSYFLQKPGLMTRLRGVIRFLTGKESGIFLDYQSAIIRMLKVANAVVCSSVTQKDFILQFNSNVHISLDFFLNDIQAHKKSYISSGKLKLVWEGQAYTVQNLLKIKEVFRKLANKIELHVVTDAVVKYPFKIFDQQTSSILSQLPCEHFFYPWEARTFSNLIAEMDLAIIPIDKNDELHWNKPENKLLLFWQIGIPVLTSNTISYTNVMTRANLPCLCSSNEDWVQKIEAFIEMEVEKRQQWVAKADEYIQNNHKKEMILKNWDNIFSSIL